MKKILMVLAPFFFIVAIFFFAEAYSLFESTKTNTSQIDIAKWQIKLNDTKVEGKTQEFTIDEVNWNDSINVKSGKVAPGMTGYFDIEIDPNNTDTSIRYDVTFDFSNLDENQFVIEEIKEIDNKPITRTGEFTYSNIISLDNIKNGETNTIRVYLSWINDENNNEKDSELGKVLDNKLEIPVKVDITQHFDGELLVEYIGD